MQSRLTDLYQANQSNRKFTTTSIKKIYLSKIHVFIYIWRAIALIPEADPTILLWGVFKKC